MAGKTNVSLMQKGCRLKRVTGPLAPKIMPRLPMKLIVNERKQLIKSLVVTAAPVMEQFRYFTSLIHLPVFVHYSMKKPK
jgi:hypothetical protein